MFGQTGDGWLKFDSFSLLVVIWFVHIIATLVECHSLLLSIISEVVLLIVEFVVASKLALIVELVDIRPGANKLILSGPTSGSIAFAVGGRVVGEE